MNFVKHTNNDICGAIIEPIRPNIEVMPTRDIRNSVGNISVVYTYMILNAIHMENLLLKNTNNLVQKYSEKSEK